MGSQAATHWPADRAVLALGWLCLETIDRSVVLGVGSRPGPGRRWPRRKQPRRGTAAACVLVWLLVCLCACLATCVLVCLAARLLACLPAGLLARLPVHLLGRVLRPRSNMSDIPSDIATGDMSDMSTARHAGLGGCLRARGVRGPH